MTINTTEFYEKLVNGDVLPTTSQPTPAAFAEVYERIANTGDTAVVITVAYKLSGTYQSATIAAEDHPDSVFVMDGRSVAIGTTVLVQYALKLVEAGKSAREVFDALLAIRSRVCVTGVLDTLDYLHKGGRIPERLRLPAACFPSSPLSASTPVS